MRELLILGRPLEANSGAATRIAMDKGAKVAHAKQRRAGALRASPGGTGRRTSSCAMFVALDIGLLVRLPSATERILHPGGSPAESETDARRAVDAIRARRQGISFPFRPIPT